MPEFCALGAKEALSELKTVESGLSVSDAAGRLRERGPNELKREKKESLLALFLNQFKDFLIIVLIAAAIVAFLVAVEEGEEPIDSIVISVVVVLNAIIGFVQEYRAEKSLEALKRMVSPTARVIRGGEEVKVPTSEIVPGDIVMLEAGDRVPADGRLIEALDLKVDEAALTGESTAVEKSLDKLKKGTQLADRRCMVYSGTVIVYGKAKAVVSATGMKTELGKIASMVQQTEREQTPLQKRLATVGKQLGIGILIICAIVFFVGMFRFGWSSENVVVMFLAAVALAVAAIPESLPAVVTMALAIGTQRMAKRHAIIRKLPAVETLGSCDVICSDKTGTFTKNEMTVKRVYVSSQELDVSGSGYSTVGDFLVGGKTLKAVSIKGLNLLVKCGVLCNNASLEGGGFGDPTERALLVLGEKADMKKKYLEGVYRRVDEIQFDSERKRMSTINKQDGKPSIYTKGAVEVVLNLCSQAYEGGKAVKLTAEKRRALLERNDAMADDALRVLGLAYREGGGEEKDLVFLGMVGMIDPPREEVQEALAVCKTAGIDVKMITGDHAITARAIAREIGLPDGDVITGVELEKMSDAELEKRVEHISVFARVNPEHKLRIVRALKANGHVVAMTGDGVNDAPALKRADIGVAMGITGTEVTKEAGSMILMDDDFSTIVAAVEEGRGIYDNVKKFIRFLLSSNLGEVMTLFLGILLFPIKGPVLMAVQILWVNLATDGAPALALGVDPKKHGIMRMPPRPANEKIFSGIMLKTILLVGLVMAVGTLSVYYIYNPGFASEGHAALKAGTMAFTTLVMFQMVNVFNSRTEKESLLKAGVLKNRWLLVAVAASIILQFAVIYVPFLSTAFRTVPLSIIDWGVVILVSLSVLVAVEIYKWSERRR